MKIAPNLNLNKNDDYQPTKELNGKMQSLRFFSGQNRRSSRFKNTEAIARHGRY